jgi:hypothetical protein
MDNFATQKDKGQGKRLDDSSEDSQPHDGEEEITACAGDTQTLDRDRFNFITVLDSDGGDKSLVGTVSDGGDKELVGRVSDGGDKELVGRVSDGGEGFVVFVDLLSGAVTSLTCWSSDTIGNVLGQLQCKVGVNPASVRLAFAGKLLEDDGSTLVAYNIQKESRLVQIPRCHGGAVVKSKILKTTSKPKSVSKHERSAELERDLKEMMESVNMTAIGHIQCVRRWRALTKSS